MKPKDTPSAESGNSSRHSRTWIVLPAYNEVDAIPSLFQGIQQTMEEAQLGYQIILVDDGSTDGTATIAGSSANNHHVRIIHHDINLGLGATIRDGLVEAAKCSEPYDIIVTMDADNTHPPELIPSMVKMIHNNHDVVVASRYRRGSHTVGVTTYRRLLSVGASTVVNLLFPTRGVRDFTCGFRAYRASVTRHFISDPTFFDQGGFQVMLDILLKLRKDPSIRFGEVPLVLRYDLKEGASKMDVRRTVASSLRLIVRRRFRPGPTPPHSDRS